MSKVVIQGNASGTGNFTIAAPNSNTDRTFNLPDETGSILASSSTAPVGFGYTHSSVSAVGSSAVTFSNIPSGVTQVTLVTSALSSDTAGEIKVRLGTSSGIVTTGYEAVSGYFLTGVVTNALTDGFYWGGWSSVTNTENSFWTFQLGHNNDWTGMGKKQDEYYPTYITFGVGKLSLASELTQIQITSSGNFDSGSVGIRYS